jgi:chromosome partitioning protein
MPARLVVVAGTKGGCGKTATASNLLLAARLAGLAAAGIDCDPQESWLTWAADRAQAGRQPAVTVIPGRLTGWREAVAAAPSAELIVLDLAPGLERGAETLELRELALAARLTLIPSIPEGPSVRKLADVGAALRQAGADVWFVLNKTIAGRAILADARSYLRRRGDLAVVEIPMRDAIHRAMDSGLAVVEEDDFGGCREFRELWRLVAAHIGLTTREAA